MTAVLLPIIIIALAASTQYYLASRCDWQCQNCGHTFSLSPLQAIFMPHRMGGRKLARCPDCGTLSWVTPVRKQVRDPH